MRVHLPRCNRCHRSRVVVGIGGWNAARKWRRATRKGAHDEGRARSGLVCRGAAKPVVWPWIGRDVAASPTPCFFPRVLALRRRPFPDDAPLRRQKWAAAPRTGFLASGVDLLGPPSPRIRAVWTARDRIGRARHKRSGERPLRAGLLGEWKRRWAETSPFPQNHRFPLPLTTPPPRHPQELVSARVGLARARSTTRGALARAAFFFWARQDRKSVV